MNQSLLKLALANLSAIEKEAFVPMPGGQPPPMDPAMAAGGMAPPMDPAMMAGGMAPPMDPAMMGGGMAPPMDPNAGAAMPPMDPAMLQMLAGAMPPAPAEESVLPPEILQAIKDAVTQAIQETGGKSGDKNKTEGGDKKKSVEDRLAAIEAALQSAGLYVEPTADAGSAGFGPGAGQPAQMPPMAAGPLDPNALMAMGGGMGGMGGGMVASAAHKAKKANTTIFDTIARLKR